MKTRSWSSLTSFVVGFGCLTAVAYAQGQGFRCVVKPTQTSCQACEDCWYDDQNELHCGTILGAAECDLPEEPYCEVTNTSFTAKCVSGA